MEKSNKELETLKEKLQNTPSYHTVEFVEQKTEKKLEEIKTCIMEKIKSSNKTTEKQIEEKMKSYATVAASSENGKNNSNDNTNLREVVKSVRHAELVEEHNKKFRSKNIIIHGVLESNDENHDQQFVTNLSKDIHSSITIKHIARLGEPNEGKNRPIKVTLDSEDEKFKLFGNLSALRGIEKYKGMCVTEDLTQQERKQFKELANAAKAKNQENPEEEYI